MRRTVSLLLILCLVGGLAVGVSAATGMQQIEVSYQDISILVDGKPVTSDLEPFLYKDEPSSPCEL